MHVLIDGRVDEGERAPLIKDIRRWLIHYPAQIGMTVIAGPTVRYDDAMLTGIVVIAESHISVHVNRESRMAHVDVFSCRPFDVERVVQDVADTFKLVTWQHSAYIRQGDWLSDPGETTRLMDAGVAVPLIGEFHGEGQS